MTGAHPRVGLRPTGSARYAAVLLRVAWLAILLGLSLQLAVLLATAGFGIFAGVRPLLADTVKGVGWSLLVCTGIAVGRAGAKLRVPLMGITGLLAAPLALTVANMLQKGVAEALAVAGPRVGVPALWVLGLKAAEYGCLGVALGWVGRQAWGGLLAHLEAGLVIATVFGETMLALVTLTGPKPPSVAAFVARGVNELLFPIGWALVVFVTGALATRLDPGRSDRSQQPTLEQARCA